MKLLLSLCIMWAHVLCATITAADSPQLCTFPEQCLCSLGVGNVLRCNTMENCINQGGMDAIASSIHSDTCPVEKFSMTCARTTVWPTFEITAQLFRHNQWRPLKSLIIGSMCSFVFKQRNVLSLLPNLVDLAIQNANISVNLTQFSEIFCCPPNLSQLQLIQIGEETSGTRFGRSSFVGFHALSKLIIMSSPKLMDQIDLLLNTSSPTFQFRWYGNLSPANGNFSSLSITNLVNESALVLGLFDNKAKFSLDAPANIVGFRLTKLVITGTKLVQIGESPFRGFNLKDVTVTGSGLNDKLLQELLSAFGRNENRTALGILALEFKLSKRAFPFDDFNALCTSVPLRQLSISYSSISFGESGRYLECPELRRLSLSNCGLQDADLPPQVFSRMSRLTNLRLMSNNLYTFPKEALNFTSQLVYLDLSRNFNLAMQASSLHGILPSLQTLILSQISIAEPLTDAFVGQPNLTELHMDSARLIGHDKCVFSKTWFNNCSKLKTLSLRKNGFFGNSLCHADGFFDPLVNLEVLSLERCGFGQQSDGIVKSLLTRLTSLRSLGLLDNRIGRLEFIISGMPNLTNLDVSYNTFSSIPPDLLLTKTPSLKTLNLVRTPIASIDPKTFNRMSQIRIRLGANQFSCTCDLLPFTDWLRLQWPTYQIEMKGDWLYNAVCYTISNETTRLLDFNMSWWDCYSRRLIMILATSIAALLLIFGIISLVVKYRWKLQYGLLAFCIRHHLVTRRVPSEWIYDACFIYDETDDRVSQWVEDLINKLETDLQLRLYEPERDAPVGANILDEAASAIDKSRHAVLVLTRGFLENRLNMYSAQWSNESLFMRRRSLAVMVMRERLSESELRMPGCKVLHRLYRMCKPDRIVDCIGCGVGGNSANRLGLMLYNGARMKHENHGGSEAAEAEPLLTDE